MLNSLGDDDKRKKILSYVFIVFFLWKNCIYRFERKKILASVLIGFERKKILAYVFIGLGM